ncbi:MAG: class I SAM-dependent methyltransferase [Candidatus Thorarchaeota archaeon]|jgi:tRNA wybutosine-synthesizing protein 2
MQYREYLRNALDGILPDTVDLPRGFHLVGHVVLVTLNSEIAEFATQIGKATLEYSSKIKSVAVRMGPTEGVTRKPAYRLVAGDSNTLTTHIENDVHFRIDPLRLTFSGGNRLERISLPQRVQPHEYVVDMFACVGQFGLHIAKKSGAKVTAIEINPEAYQLLQENIQLNGVQDHMDALLGDCRVVHPVDCADRVVMGYLHDTIDFLPAGLETLSSKGGWIHLHTTIPESERKIYCNTITTVAESVGYSSIINVRKIKHYSPGIVHYVFDIELAEE